MAVTLSLVGNITNGAGSMVTVNASGAASGYTAIDYQYAMRPDFRFCLTQITRVGGLYQTFTYLNQDATYFIRARSVLSSGLVEPWGPVLPMRTGIFDTPSTSPAGVMIQPALIVVPIAVAQWVQETPTVAGYPPENLSRDAPVAWRAINNVDVPPFFVIRAHTAGEPVDTFAILNTNLPDSAVVQIQGSVTNDFSTPAFDTGYQTFRASRLLSGRPSGYHGLIRLATPQSYPWWRIIMRGYVPGNIISVDHIVMGKARASKNFSADMTETPIDLGSLSRIRSGNPDRISGFRMRKVSFDLSFMTESQHATRYADLGWRVGSTDPVLVVPNSKAGFAFHDRILYGALSASKYVNPTSPRWTDSFTVDSII